MLQTVPRHIFDPRFQYIPADKTDIRATFDRIRREQQQTLEQVANQFNAIDYKGN
jgi:hypothetical protein